MDRLPVETRLEFKRPRFMDKMNVRDKSIGRPAMITRTTGVVNKRGSDVREPLANGQVSRSTNLNRPRMMQLDAIKQIPDKIGSIRNGIHIKGSNDSFLKGIDIGQRLPDMERQLRETDSKLIQLNKLMIQLGGDERNQVEDVIRVLHEQRNALQELIRVKQNISDEESKKQNRNMWVDDAREEIMEKQARREEQQQKELMDLKDLVEEQSREIANHVYAKGEDSDVDDMREELEENIVKLEKLQYDYRMQSKKLKPTIRPGADTAIFENLYRQFQGSGKTVHDFIFKSPLNKDMNRKDPSLKDMGCDKFSFIGDHVNKDNTHNLKITARAVIEQAFDEYLESDEHKQYLLRLDDAQGSRLSAFVGKKEPVEENLEGKDDSEPGVLQLEPGNPNSVSADQNSASADPHSAGVVQHANGRKHHPINMLGYGKRGSNSLTPPLFNFSNYLGRS